MSYNACEHCENPAPNGQRFCKYGCQICEHLDNANDEKCSGACYLSEQNVEILKQSIETSRKEKKPDIFAEANRLVKLIYEGGIFDILKKTST